MRSDLAIARRWRSVRPVPRGERRTTGTGAAAAPAIWVCGRGVRATALARALSREARVHASSLPAARLSTAAADAASARLADQAWRALGRVDAAIIVPTVATASGRRKPGRAARSTVPVARWRAAIDATVRASYLVGRAAGLAFERQGSGIVLVVIDAAPDDDAVGAVTSEALSCLVDTLGRALRRTVRVAELVIAGRDPSPASLARHLLQALAAPPPGPHLIVRSGARSAG